MRLDTETTESKSRREKATHHMETIPINVPRNLKLTDEQTRDLWLQSKKASKGRNAEEYLRDRLLSDLLDALGDPHAEAKKAFAQGKMIQWRKLGTSDWKDCAWDDGKPQEPAWICGYEYRAKPEEPWVPKVGDWVKVTGVWEQDRAFRVHSIRVNGDVEYADGHAYSADCGFRPATAEEIAAAKSKILADKRFEAKREYEAKLQQIEEECK